MHPDKSLRNQGRNGPRSALLVTSAKREKQSVMALGQVRTKLNGHLDGADPYFISMRALLKEETAFAAMSIPRN